MPAKHTTETGLVITLSEAKELIARTKVAAEDGNLLGMIMPNGLPLGECTGEYLRALST